MIKICTIDLDGTLFDTKKNISDKNKEAIKYASKKGCKVVIASGRPVNGILQVLKDLDLYHNDYAMSYNGALVFNTSTNEIIHKTFIKGKDVKMLYNEAMRLGLYIHAFRENQELICNKPNPYTDIEMRINKIGSTVYDFNTIDDDENFIKCMMIDSEDKITQGMKDLDEYFYNKHTVVRSSRYFLEFLDKSTDKGFGLKALAEYLNVDLKDTMAIGDAGNDLGMINTAGIGVAMENAFEEIKKAATFVTTSNENDGVANAIYKFIK